VRRLLFALLCTLSLFAAPAVQAATLFNVGPGGSDAALVTMTRLPAWVQVADARAALYTTDAGNTLAGSKLARYTFLRVLGGGAYRLQVDAFDDSGSPVLRGWIDPETVLPSAPGTDWFVAANPTSLLRTADDGSATLRGVDRFTPLQKLDGPQQGRILVRVYRPDFSGVVDQGWVDVSDIGPALAPQARVGSQTERALALKSLTSNNQKQAFLDAVGATARADAARTGVPASVAVAQAILESDWGSSALAQDANNYFGIKAIGSLGSDGVVWMPTSEYDESGGLYQTLSAFRAYKSLADSMNDYDRLLVTDSRYASAMQATNDPKQFAALLAQGGYSTDPTYADKLVELMDNYNLYRLDS
jgi:hypothetical protein